jgi:hypothetical protein
MSRGSDVYLQGVPTKAYDLLREGLIFFLLWTVLVVVLVVGFGSPDYLLVCA